MASMTEHEWRTSVEPASLLAHVKGAISPRKLRLIACASVRAVWMHLIDERSQVAVEVAERFADGHATEEELLAAERAAWEVAQPVGLRATATDPAWAATRAAARAATLDAYSAATNATFIASLSEAPWSINPYSNQLVPCDPVQRTRAREKQCAFLRDIVGNPFRHVVVDSSWLTWHDLIVPRLAEEIYDLQRFEELPVVADALEEAGCTSSDLLDHLRDKGPHVRGCWALDLLRDHRSS